MNNESQHSPLSRKIVYVTTLWNMYCILLLYIQMLWFFTHNYALHKTNGEDTHHTLLIKCCLKVRYLVCIFTLQMFNGIKRTHKYLQWGKAADENFMLSSNLMKMIPFMNIEFPALFGLFWKLFCSFIVRQNLRNYFIYRK